jgi:hypothetical protein
VSCESCHGSFLPLIRIRAAQIHKERHTRVTNQELAEQRLESAEQTIRAFRETAAHESQGHALEASHELARLRRELTETHFQMRLLLDGVGRIGNVRMRVGGGWVSVNPHLQTFRNLKLFVDGSLHGVPPAAGEKRLTERCKETC